MPEVIHSFGKSLKRSHEIAGEPFWEEIYREFFPDFHSMAYIEKDGWAQRGGVDRIIVLGSSRIVKIQEKCREEVWPDILLERWSDRGSRKPGWIQENLDCDYLAYVFLPTKECHMLPFLALRRAWRMFGREWIERYPPTIAANRGWVTEGVPVPIAALYLALSEASRVCPSRETCISL